MSERKTIVFVCSSGLHVKLFASTIRLLAEQSALSVFVMSLDDFYALIHGDVKDRVHDLNLPVRIIEPEFGAETCKGLAGRILAAWKNSAAIESIYRSIGTSLVVVGNDTGHPERAALGTARRCGIPSVLVQDGFLSDRFSPGISRRLQLHLFRLWISLGGRNFGAIPYGMGGCDIVAAHGSAWAPILERCCRRKETRIEITGHPALTLPSEFPPFHMGHRRVIFFCTNYLSGYKDRVAHKAQIDEILMLRRLITQHFGEEIVIDVKPHPADRTEDYDRLRGIPGISIRSDQETPELIRRAWFCMTNISSVSLECLVNGRICLMSGISLQKKNSYRHLFASLPGIKFTDWHTFAKQLDALCSERGYEDLLKSQFNELQPWVGNVPGDSGAKRLAELIVRTAKA